MDCPCLFSVAYVVETNQLYLHRTDDSIHYQLLHLQAIGFTCRLLLLPLSFNASFSMFKLALHQLKGNEFHIFTMDLTKGLLCAHTWDCKPVTS